MKPQVTVIGISYNHGPYIQEALGSLWAQQYPNLQVILMDDGSMDDSAERLRQAETEQAVTSLILHSENMGYTRTFNEGLALATGKYIIDFAMDDVMLPGFIEKSIGALEKAGEQTGVSFSNADYIDAKSEIIANHFDTLRSKGMIDEMPSGDVFEMMLRRYFVCTPTMVIRKSVFDRIGGYDPELAFEDLDFWVRSSRYFDYLYLDETLMQKRKLKTSMSANRLQHWQNEQLSSVFSVCQKAFALCKTKPELKALRERLAYEYRQCVRSHHGELAAQYLDLMEQTGGNTLKARFSGWLLKAGVRLTKVKAED